MSNYNWCHGTHCHEQPTQSRIRGTGDNKVLRTIKIKETHWNQNSPYKYFCNQGCLMNFINTHLEEIVNIAPVQQPKETPIKVEKEKYESYRYQWQGDDANGPTRVPYMATKTKICDR